MKTKNYLQSVLLRNLVYLVITGILLSGNIFAQTFNHDYQDGRIYFKYKDNISLNFTVHANNSVDMDAIPFLVSLEKDFRLKSVERPFDLNNDIKLLHTFMLEFEDFDKIDQIISRLSENSELEYVERVPLDRISFVPNDTLYNMYNGPSNWKWHLDRIQAEMAWDITKGSSDINIAIVDNAVWADHPDLAGKIVAERDVVYNTNNSNPPTSGDPYAWSHGTHCAGLAAASTDNTIGVASIGYNVSIIAVKAATNSNPENISGAYSGIQWAANNGADVISMSWGGGGYSASNQNLINTIHNMGIVLIGAAGNENVSTPHYPSSYNNVISIASTDGNDVKSDFSNYGTTIDLCAPGGSNAGGPGGLLSTTFSTGTYGNYDLMQGTSMATPVASGMAGLILSVNPELTPVEVENIMKSTADDIYPVNPDYIGMLGSGRINAFKAVLNTPFSPTANFSTPVTTILPGTSINFNDISIGVPSQWEWSFEGGNPSTSSDKNPAGITYSSAGTYNVSLTVTNGFGTSTLTLNDYITVTATPVPYIFMSVSDTNPCIGNSVFLTDSSLYNPTAWEWSFNPATIAFLNGTTANSQNAEVKFLAPGDYALEHKVWNVNGFATKSFDNLIHVSGAVPDYNVNMEDETSGYFILWDTLKSQAKVDARAAFESNFGIHLHGVPTPVGWKGGAASTTAEQAWIENRAFQAEAHICGVDATGIPYVVLSLDLHQTYSLGSRFSWFRVLVNGQQIADDHGVMDFNPATAADDPWAHLYFDLSPYTGSVFDITLQSACRFSDKSQGEGDNVFIDNISITNTTITGIKKSENSVITVSPNPSDGRIKVTASSIENKAVLTVNSMIGNTVFTKNVTSDNGVIHQDIDLSFLLPGIYMVTITDNNKQINQRFVIR
jgi:subtilisin family serine protease